MTSRITLRRADGTLYLDRRGFECKWFGIYIHRIGSGDPGVHPHNHPWWFASLVLRGGYQEDVYDVKNGTVDTCTRRWRLRWSLRSIRKDQAHHILWADPNTITLVMRGRRFRQWGFYTPHYVHWEDMPRVHRDLTVENLK